jgi:hypothetical protein
MEQPSSSSLQGALASCSASQRGGAASSVELGHHSQQGQAMDLHAGMQSLFAGLHCHARHLAQHLQQAGTWLHASLPAAAASLARQHGGLLQSQPSSMQHSLVRACSPIFAVSAGCAVMTIIMAAAAPPGFRQLHITSTLSEPGFAHCSP